MVDLQVVISRINKSCKRVFHGMKLVNISSKYNLLTAFAVLAAHYVFTVLGNLIHRDQVLAENISRWWIVKLCAQPPVIQRISGKLTGFRVHCTRTILIRTYGEHFRISPSIADAITIEVELVRVCFRRFGAV